MVYQDVFEKFSKLQRTLLQEFSTWERRRMLPTLCSEKEGSLVLMEVMRVPRLQRAWQEMAMRSTWLMTMLEEITRRGRGGLFGLMKLVHGWSCGLLKFLKVCQG